MTSPVEDEFTELVDADIPRVDLVDKAANGTRFLIAKQANGAPGLLDASVVRDLVRKSEPEPPKETVTMTGSPGAIARLIHEAARRRAVADVTKAKYDADDRNRMASSGAAMDDGSYPIADREDLDNAIHAVGRGGADHDAIRRHIIARAKALGASSEIPDNWAADGSLKEGTVAKAMELDDGMDGMDPTIALAAPEDEAPGDPSDPGSPAWEAIDAATARKWTSILARAKSAIDLLADREMMEAASGADPDDAEQAMDLQDACCAIDYAISVLAPFAVAEQAEADCGEQMAAVGKALTGFDTAPLDTIESLAYVSKAGRVLSTANEAAIRGAVESLQKVLASLPQAPQAPDDSGRPVAKEEQDMADIEAAATEETSAESVEKADAEKVPQVAVYDQKGHLVGIVDPGEITPIAGAEADPDDDGDGADDNEPAPAADTADLTPAPAAEVGTPASTPPDDVTKQTDTIPTDDTPTDMFKSIATDAAKSAIADYSATQEQVIAKQAADLAQMADVVETLKGRLEALEEQPAVPKVFTNGAVPPQHLMRGQDRGAAPVDVAKARELKKGLYGARNATEQNRIATDMQADAIVALQEIHQRRAQ